MKKPYHGRKYSTHTRMINCISEKLKTCRRFLNILECIKHPVPMCPIDCYNRGRYVSARALSCSTKIKGVYRFCISVKTMSLSLLSLYECACVFCHRFLGNPLSLLSLYECACVFCHRFLGNHLSKDFEMTYKPYV